MSEHDRLYKAAEKAIDDLFSDTSVSQSETKRALKSLADLIELKVYTLQDSE